MSQIEHLIKISKNWAKSFLRGEEFDFRAPQELLNEEDKKEIEKKLNQKSYWEDRNAFLDNININKEWESIEGKIYKKKNKYSLYKYAAIFVAVIGISFFFSNQKNPTQPSNIEIAAGSDNAILTLKNGEQVILKSGMTYKNDNARIEENKLHYKNSPSSEKSLSFNYLTIPRGGRFQLELADGTMVWLNSESKIKYPVNFIAGETREVELLYGEAYFEVSHSSEHNGDAYSVITNNQKIEVLGTKFNVRAYKQEAIYTTLAHGSIAISKEGERKILSPGEQAENIDSQLNIVPVDVDYEVAWKNGLFMFEQEPLQEMMTTLSRWYDIEVVFENTQKKTYTFSGVLNRDDDLLKLLKTFEKTNEVIFEIQQKRIIIR